MEHYHPQTIRHVIKYLGKGFSEIYTPHSNSIRYFQNKERLVELKMDEDYLDIEVELLCTQLGIRVEDFEVLYRKARKHKLKPSKS